jgi:hypothetical protein
MRHSAGYYTPTVYTFSPGNDYGHMGSLEGAFLPHSAAANPGEEEEESLPFEQIAAGARAVLGIDDTRKQLVRLKNRLRDLQYGKPAERTAAMLAAGSFTLQGAIQKTQARIAEMESAAFQTRTRDRLYTVGVVAGVVVAGAAAAWFTMNAYSRYQEARIRRVEFERLSR